MKRIKLLVLTHNYPRFEGDYAGVFLHLLMKKLPPYGIDPVVLAPHDAGAKEFEEIEGVRIHRFRYATNEEDQDIAYKGVMHKLILGSVTGIFKFKRFLDKFRSAAIKVIADEKIDLLAGQWLIPSGLVMKSIGKKTGLPMIMASHGTDIRLIRKYAGAVYSYLRPTCRKFKSWTLVSSYLRDEMLRIDPLLEKILETLPMPHDESVFFEDDRVEREPELIVAVTRFTEQKRVDLLIKALALVDERGTKFKLEIYGEGALKAEAEALITRFGLAEKIKLFDPVPQVDLARVYNRAAIVVLNSVREGFGLALSEGMLCGAAVIGVDSGGIRDIIENEKRGLLVEPDNPSALADAIERLLTDHELRQTLSASGKSYARSNYASDASASRYAEIIRNAVGE